MRSNESNCTILDVNMAKPSLLTAKKYRPEIDGLRALAIIPVVLLHAGFTFFSGGFLGVDIFFVISGYLITSLIIREIQQQRFQFINFWLRRARRILPALFCMVMATLIAGWFFFLPDDFKSLGRSAAALSLFASNIYFWLKTGYFTAPAETKPLLHTWTLAVEEQFYLFFPLMLIVITRYIARFRIQVIAFIMLLCFVCSWYLARYYPLAAFFLLPSRAWELLLGSVVALYFYAEKKTIPPWLNEGLGFAGLLAILYAVLAYDQNTPLPTVTILPALGTVAIIAANQYQTTLVGRLLSTRALVGIGLISYSLYLWHWPFLVFSKYLALSPLTLMQTLLVLLASIIVAMMSYRWVEKPIRSGYIMNRSSVLITTATMSTCLIGILGLTINVKEGMPLRLNTTILAAYQEAAMQALPKCQTIQVTKNTSVCSNAKKGQVPHFILWGDSHADMLLPLVEKLANQHHLRFWYYACVPILDVYSVSKHASLASSNCYLGNHEIIKVIKEKHIKNVLFASFWSQFTEGKEVPLEGAGQRDPFYADANTISSSPEEARMVFQKHFIETVNVLKSADANVWIMEQVPSYLYWVPNQLAKTLKYGGDTDTIGRPLSEYLKTQSFVNTVFDKVHSDKVHLLKPTEILCDQSAFCHATNHGHSLYRDYNHLSHYGVMKLSPLFNNMFNSFEDAA